VTNNGQWPGGSWAEALGASEGASEARALDACALDASALDACALDACALDACALDACALDACALDGRALGCVCALDARVPWMRVPWMGVPSDACASGGEVRFGTRSHFCGGEVRGAATLVETCVRSSYARLVKKLRTSASSSSRTVSAACTNAAA
jgi:hypothetical protein